jgi:hypothetical protein
LAVSARALETRFAPPRHRDVALAISVWCVIATALVPLARGLPSRSFFVGDPGVKLIAAQNAISHPARPLDIDLPKINGHPVDFVDPFFLVRGDHAHALTPELFALMTAPLVAAFGMRGAYVLPAAGFLITLAAIAWLGKTLDERRSWTELLITTAAGTPLFFYALEFWEHTLAVGVAATGTVLFVRRRSRRSVIAAGVFLGIAALLRPEAIAYCVALFIAARWLLSMTVIDLSLTGVGISIPYVPFTVADALHSGHFLGGHLTRNMAGLTERWLTTRAEIVPLWFAPPNIFWLAAFVLVLLAALAVRNGQSRKTPTCLIALAFVTIAAVAAARRHFPIASAWNGEPALLLALLPCGASRAGQKFLLAVAVTFSFLVVTTTPADGGGQWSPRLLLFACIPLSILTADVIEQAAVPAYRMVARPLTAVLLIAAMLIQRNAYKELQAAKRTYARVVTFVEHETRPGGYIVTDLWWLDQVTAALYPTHTVMFIQNGDAANRAFRLLASASQVFIVTSDVESTLDLVGREFHPDFVIEREVRIPDRSLAIVELRNETR